MAKRQSSSEISEDLLLKCSVCKKFLKEPKLLACLHSACSDCINKERVALKGQVTCPLCDHITIILATHTLDDLPTPFHISDLIEEHHVESSEAKRNVCSECGRRSPSQHCTICGLICTGCVESHKNMKTFESHVLSSLSKGGQITIRNCKHGKQLEFYCRSCSKVCCEVCTCVREHSDNVIAVREMKHEEVTRLCKVLSERESITEEKLKDVHKLMGEVQNEGTSACKRIESIWADLLKVLEEHKSSLQKKIRKIEEEKLAAIESQECELHSFVDSIKHVEDAVALCVNSKNPVSKATCSNFLKNRMGDKIQEFESMPMEVCTIPEIKVLQSSELENLLKDHITVVSPANLALCSVEGPAVHSGIVGQTNKFTLHTVYGDKQPCMEKQNVKAELIHHSLCKAIPCTVEYPGTGNRYDIIYTVMERGRYELTVSVNGDSLPECPYELTVFIDPKEMKSYKKINNLVQPYQVAFTSKNEMLVTQKGNNSIKRLQSDDRHQNTPFIIDSQRNMSDFKPTGIAIDEQDNVYVSYENKGSIMKFDIHGKVQNRTSDGELHRPGRLFYRENTKEIFVCERGKDRIQVYNTNLEQVREFAAGIRCSSVTCDKDGTTYVADKNGCNILKFSEEGVRIREIFPPKALSAPRGVCLQNGYMFVADRDNGRIAIFSNYSAQNPEIVNTVTLLDQDLGSVISDVYGYIYVCNERYNYILVL